MRLLLIFLGSILGVVLFLMLITYIIYVKILNYSKKMGFGNISELKKMIKDGEYRYKNDKKSVSGMTKLLVPKIVKDFPNFSESELFKKTETSLLLIFKSLENNNIENKDELILLKNNLKEVINDNIQNKIKVRYDDIKFHNHAIKYYKKDSVALSITISTSLEYYYEKTIDKKIINRNNYKKQTSYTTEFIYVYNPDDYSNQDLVGINCPNCGAPIKNLGHKKCMYCGSGLEDINLKNWYIISYKEDY